MIKQRKNKTGYKNIGEYDLILIQSYLFYMHEEGKLKGLYQNVKDT